MTTQPLPKKKKSGWLKWVLGVPAGLLLLVILIGIFGPEPEKKSDKEGVGTTTEPATASATAETVIAESAPASEENWYYSKSEDKMGDNVSTASVVANEELEFKFPYNGGSSATFAIRKKSGSTDMYLSVSKGQFITNVDGGTCRIRFDSSDPKTYSTSGAADYSSNIVFFDSEQAILKRLKTAKKMIIEIPFYNEGNRQIEFDVHDLKWK